MHVNHLLTVGALLFTVLEAAPLAGNSKAPVCLMYSMLTPVANMASVRRSKYNLVISFRHCLLPSCPFYANLDLKVLQISQGYVPSSSPLMTLVPLTALYVSLSFLGTHAIHRSCRRG